MKIINDEGLLTFWDRVRTSNDRIKEIIAKKGYSKTLDESIFTAAEDDEEENLKTELPFQIAYAVTIHKAQGLEYRSVKIVITDEVDELITHNIFYIAITRARENLRIYWTPEVEQAVLERIKPKDIKKDVGILRKYLST